MKKIKYLVMAFAIAITSTFGALAMPGDANAATYKTYLKGYYATTKQCEAVRAQYPTTTWTSTSACLKNKWYIVNGLPGIYFYLYVRTS